MLRGFNSSLVRLIEIFPLKSRQLDFMFQFQFGTIDSSQHYATALCSQKFQFQFGTIDRKLPET